MSKEWRIGAGWGSRILIPGSPPSRWWGGKWQYWAPAVRSERDRCLRGNFQVVPCPNIKDTHTMQLCRDDLVEEENTCRLVTVVVWSGLGAGATRQHWQGQGM